MAQKLKHKEPNPTQGSPTGQAPAAGGGNVASLPTHCKAEGCKKKSEKMDFCSEHYEWFKWGLVTKEGKKPLDFDKKYQSFLKHKKAA